MEEYRKYIQTAAKLLQGENSWMDFKKIMLQSLPSYMRKKFSTRHPKTKKQALNEFEKNMINIYFAWMTTCKFIYTTAIYYSL